MSSHSEFPRKIKLSDDVFIGPDEKCFIVAEIGQNHQGDLSTAKELILLAKQSGADCVKFQKTHLPSKFNKRALLRPYTGPNSWGDTYGAHKQFLEFTELEFTELKTFSQEHDILFSSSAMDEVSLMFLDSLNIPFIKIGSGDFHNKWLIKKAGDLNKPLIVSTGMSNVNEVVDVYEVLKAKHSNFCLLHCVSSYPLPYEEINLNVISTYKKLFPDVNIGYSGHEVGIDVAVAAAILGAKVVEKHFTLDKTWKGSDHVCSLTPPEFKEMVSNIRKFEAGMLNPNTILSKEIVQKALGDHEKKFQVSETPCFQKLGKTVVAAAVLLEGETVTWDNIRVKVAEPKGVLGRDVGKIIGKTVKRKFDVDESILSEDLI